jgi:succinoglycan biosynthesis protein ExoM
MLVAVCVITYKREQGLRRLLKGLNELTFEKIEHPEVEVIIVDNDTAGLAARICAELQPNFQWRLKTDVETQRGITYARNRSISLASPNADFIAILDDDEIPRVSWLENLLLVQKEYNSDIVAGLVVPYFPEKTVPRWIVRGGFFDTPAFKTGEKRSVAFTNNVLVRAEILRSLNPVFDNRFAIAGGSDAYLFLTLNKAGYKIIWANEAVVEDWIPCSRTNLKWILFRGYRTWSNYSAYEKELYPSLTLQTIRILKGLTLIILGILRLIPSLLLGKVALATSLLFIFRGMGTLGGLLDLYYQEYKNIATSPEPKSESKYSHSN